MTSSDRSPVITGIGVVCALGTSTAEVVQAALAGQTGIRNSRHLFEDEGFGVPPCASAALVPGFEAALDPEERSRASSFAWIASEEALGRAGLAGVDRAATIDPDRIGVVSGSAAPAADLYFGVARRTLVDGLESVRGRTTPNLSAAAPAAVVALEHGLRGPNYMVSAACATGSLVVLSAADQVRTGRADAMIAVATESPVTAIGLASFARAGALAETCRPFDARRRGLVVGEGAAALVIESEAHARARGVTPIARVLGGAMTDDAHHMWTPDVGSWARTLQLALNDAGVAPADVDYVAAHAPGTQIGDATEVAALRKALGSRAEEVPVWSTKGAHGHTLGSAGALEIAIAVEALRARRVPQTVGLVEADVDCRLDHVPDRGRAGRPGLVLKPSFGFGGTNCVVVLDVLEGD